jgi:hypothetical protein
MMKKLITSIILVLISFPVMAATDDFTATSDITVSNINLDGGDIEMVIMNGSSAESWQIDNGSFTVTNPGSTFNVNTADASVKTILVRQGNTNISCTLNTAPGTTYVTLPTTSATYAIIPSAITTCTGHCTTITNAATYNAYPSCGAATCNAGYNINGTGSSATCVAASSGGGGGGSSGGSNTGTDASNNGTSQTETLSTSNDGTVVKTEESVTKTNGQVVETQTVAVIDPSTNPTVTQTITLDTSKNTEVAKVELSLTSDLLQKIVSDYGKDTTITANITAKEAAAEQKTTEARGGLFMSGFDVFDVKIKAGKENITNFASPITLQFDISKFAHQKELKVFYFDEGKKKWQMAGDGGSVVGNKIVVSLSHLTLFALLWPTEVTPQKEVLSDYALHWQQIQNEASAVYQSGKDIAVILNLNKVKRNEELESETRKKYTNSIIKGIFGINAGQIDSANNFIAYGTKTTMPLGAGERAGVVNSYKSAYSKLPKSENDWIDCLAIANGRFPSTNNTQAVARAQKEFKNIYKREIRKSDPNDTAAVTILAYGLRNQKRNVKSESFATKVFRALYKTVPTAAKDWDIVRAIAYSGARK